jgi:large subunit ribosomal protein L30
VADLVIKQVRSTNGTNPKQRATLRSLRLGRIGRTVERPDTPGLRGMLSVVDHLVEVDGKKAGSGKQKAEEGA